VRKVGKYIVAVYGTLKRDYGNHHLLVGQEYLGKAISKGRFLLGHGAFPAVVPSRRGRRIVVELYRVSPAVFLRLDNLEGYPVHYDRRKFTFITPSGEEVRAWLYFYHSTKNSFHDWNMPERDDLPFWWTKDGWKPYRMTTKVAIP
jgi:gamma-glutamylcyclotransferase (GGCT)/AIG2-like uncharacterized protein YtfP